MKAIINSEKRIVQQTLSTVNEGVTQTALVVECKQDVNPSSPQEVSPGTVVKAVYVEMWFFGLGQQQSTTTTVFGKLVGTEPTISSVEMGDLNAYAGKKNLFEIHQGLVGDVNSNPIPFYRDWIKIPKGKQRMGIGDRLFLAVKGITDDTQFCGLYIYKAYN